MHRVQVHERDGVTVVRGEGELDAFAAPDLTSALAGIAPSGQAVVDLNAVSFLDSTALGALVRGLRELAERGGSASVVLPRGTARRIFEITALDRALPVAATVDAAVDELSQRADAGGC